MRPIRLVMMKEFRELFKKYVMWLAVIYVCLCTVCLLGGIVGANISLGRVISGMIILLYSFLMIPVEIIYIVGKLFMFEMTFFKSSNSWEIWAVVYISNILFSVILAFIFSLGKLFYIKNKGRWRRP